MSNDTGHVGVVTGRPSERMVGASSAAVNLILDGPDLAIPQAEDWRRYPLHTPDAYLEALRGLIDQYAEEVQRLQAAMEREVERCWTAPVPFGDLDGIVAQSREVLLGLRRVAAEVASKAFPDDAAIETWAAQRNDAAHLAAVEAQNPAWVAKGDEERGTLEAIGRLAASLDRPGFVPIEVIAMAIGQALAEPRGEDIPCPLCICSLSADEVADHIRSHLRGAPDCGCGAVSLYEPFFHRAHAKRARRERPARPGSSATPG